MHRRKSLTRLLINIVIVAAAIIYVVVSINRISVGVANEDLERLENSLNRAAISCFSIEGFYPANVDYLIDNYGIVVNEEKYHVFYESYGANLKPEIRVIRRGN